MRDEEIKKLRDALSEVERHRESAYSMYEFFKREYYNLLDELMERVNRNE